MTEYWKGNYDSFKVYWMVESSVQYSDGEFPVMEFRDVTAVWIRGDETASVCVKPLEIAQADHVTRISEVEWDGAYQEVMYRIMSKVYLRCEI